MARLFGVGLTLVLFIFPAFARGQGLLVVVDPEESVRLPRPIIIWPPHPPRPIPRPRERPAQYKIEALDVSARLTDQVAQVRVSQTFVNTGSRQLEVSFVFPLPYDGAIDQLTLLIDGKEYPAELLDAEKARRLYENIVRKNKDPALLEWMGSGLFKTSVFPVPPGAKRTVSLRYSQLLRMQDGLTDFLFPLSTAKYTSHAVEKVNIRVTIQSGEEIKNIYSPTHEVKVKRSGSKNATVTYTAENRVPTTDFRLFHDVGRGKLATRVLSYRPNKNKEGYFLLLASPKIKSAGEKPPKKTVVFVVDRSGSMSGKKIEQTRQALRFVLNNLRQGDLFNIVAYDSDVESFRPELQRFDDNTRDAALGFVEGIHAGGSTNIDAALRAALGQLQDSGRASYVVFLTDGLPTAGVTNEMEIVGRAKKANRVRARLFSFGVGYDVNSRLLDKLVRENFGQSEYVRPDEDIEDRVSRLYRRIESPVMTDVRLDFVFDVKERKAHGKPTSRVYPKGSFDLFAGEQLVMVGRYKTSGTAKVVVRGSVGGKEQKFNFPAKLVNQSKDDTHAFVEKLWAVRRVGEILDELDLVGKNEELVTELVELSIRHGILTPYTSFLADENTDMYDLTENRRRAGQRLGALEEASGAGAFVQRAYKGSLQRAKQAAPAMSIPVPASSVAGGPRAGSGRARGSSYGGMEMGMGGGMALPVADMAGAIAEAAEDLETAAQTVRQIGARTFYLRDGQWIDSTVTEPQRKQAKRIKQFSDAYFRLARSHGRVFSQYMVFDDPVVVNIGNQTYWIEP